MCFSQSSLTRILQVEQWQEVMQMRQRCVCVYYPCLLPHIQYKHVCKCVYICKSNKYKCVHFIISCSTSIWVFLVRVCYCYACFLCSSLLGARESHIAAERILLGHLLTSACISLTFPSVLYAFLSSSISLMPNVFIPMTIIFHIKSL